MNKKVEKFLEFNGKRIVMLGKDGVWWIAIKPICEALGVDYRNQAKVVTKSKILGQLWSDQNMVAADGKIRNMTSLPEFAIYGWIFQIESAAEGLEEYKWECYRVLYEHFHGTITGRKELLTEKAKAELEIDRCLNTLDPDVAFRYDKAIKVRQKINFLFI